jgi:hypothetical protein
MERSETVTTARPNRFSTSAAFYGWLVATAIAALLTALISAAGGAVALTNSTQTITLNQAQTIGIMSAVLLLLSLGLAYFAGGYVAGRMSRGEGTGQGFGVWAVGVGMAVLLAAAGALFGSSFNLLQALNLPRIPVDEGALTAGGLATLVLGLLVTLMAAMAGGKAGEDYHRVAELEEDTEPSREEMETERAGTIVTDTDETETHPYPGTQAQPSFGERIEPHPTKRLRRRM